VPPRSAAGSSDAVFDDVYRHAAKPPGQVGFLRRAGGTWVPVTYGEAAEQVTALAAGLIVSGVGPGDRVVLFSRTRFECPRTPPDPGRACGCATPCSTASAPVR